MYIINTIPHGKCFVRYLRTRCFCIRNLTRSLRSLVRFLIRQQLVRKYRTPALSMKYSLFLLLLNTYFLSPIPLPFLLPPYRLTLSTPATHARLPGLSCWFSCHHVINQTKELSNLLTFYFGEVLEQPKTNISTHFHFETVFFCA